MEDRSQEQLQIEIARKHIRYQTLLALFETISQEGKPTITEVYIAARSGIAKNSILR